MDLPLFVYCGSHEVIVEFAKCEDFLLDLVVLVTHTLNLCLDLLFNLLHEEASWELLRQLHDGEDRVSEEGVIIAHLHETGNQQLFR